MNLFSFFDYLRVLRITIVQILRSLGKFSGSRRLSDSDIPRAKAPRTPSDELRFVIPSECEGSEKDFSPCSKQGFLPEPVLSFVEGVEMTIVFFFAAPSTLLRACFASLREILRRLVAALPRCALRGDLLTVRKRTLRS